MIDLIGIENLTNDVRGWKSREYGRREARELEALYEQEPVKIREPAILVRITQLYRYGMPDNELYDVTRGVRRVNPKRGAKYAFAVFDGIVREVYEIRQWLPAGTTYSSRDPRGVRDAPGRWEFVGVVAEKALRKRYVNKSVADYFKRGDQGPIRYVNVPV